jgi:hypothetical protein
VADPSQQPGFKRASLGEVAWAGIAGSDGEGTLMTGSEHTPSPRSEEIAGYLGESKTTDFTTFVTASDSGEIASAERP